jgi:hypothetical protein
MAQAIKPPEKSSTISEYFCGGSVRIRVDSDILQA